MKKDLGKLIKNNKCEFSHLRAGFAYYNLIVYKDEKPNEIYVFPIEISDLGSAFLNKTEKAITLMRYIRRAMHEGTLILLTKPTNE